TISAVINRFAIEIAHIGEDEVDRRNAVSTIRMSGWVNETGGETSRLFDKLFRNINAGHTKPSLHQLKRQASIAARHVKHMRAGLTVQMRREEFGFSICLRRRNRFAPELERDAVKEVFVPVVWDHQESATESQRHRDCEK